MSQYFRPIIRSEREIPSNAQIMRGTAFWFTHAVKLSRNSESEIVLAKKIPNHILDKITKRRPKICRISFDTPTIMGILNVTPDSFSDGGKYSTLNAATEHCMSMVSAGADIIDIGGESTRPGAAELDAAQEISRVIPVLDKVAKEIQVPISIDTRKSEVAELAISSGAVIVNDVSGLTFDSQMAEYCINQNLPVCIMHSQGIPETMQNAPKYKNVCLDIYDFLNEQIEKMIDSGMQRSNIIVDPGIGFGKTLTHNFDLLKGISLFHGLGVPILIGVSRKKFIKELSGGNDTKNRIGGTVASSIYLMKQGVQILRIHDVDEILQGIKVFKELIK